MKKLMFAGLSMLALAGAAGSASARPMTAQDLAALHRIASPTVSADGKWLAYSLSETDLAANKRRTDLWLLDLTKKGAAAVKIASRADKNEHDPKFGKDGYLYFLSDAEGSDQVWRYLAGGTDTPEQVTSFSVDISGFALAPTGDKLAIWADRNTGCNDIDCSNVRLAGPPEGSGRTYDAMFVRHWDSWEVNHEKSRIYVVDLKDGMASGLSRSVMGELDGDSPSKPFGGNEEIAWAPDGKTLYFALRRGGPKEPNSTNLDIYASPADASAAPANLTEANLGMDTLPAVSPNGQWLAWVAMKRPTYEADRQVLHLRNLATGETRALTESWDRSIGSLAWAPDSKSLLVTAEDTLDNPVSRVDAATGKVTRLTKAGSAGNVTPLADGGFVYTLNSITAPDDIWRATKAGKSARLTAVNAAALADLDPVSVKRFSFKGANGDTVHGIITRPTNVSGKLPVAFLVHGGPQGSFNDSWSYRWNPRLFSAPGYAAVSVDFHGSTGYGQAFTDAINKDWGGKPLEDLKLGLAAAGAQDASIDISNACALGGSYGGYMMNWIAGQWPDAFKCLITHAGVFDARAMAYETEELWFDEWEHGGPYYEQAAEYEKWNPVLHVDKWKTPMLVIHGEKDFRIPYTQGLGAFTALQRRGVASRLVVFPDENHWILKPKNSIQWYGEVFAWLGKWTGKSASTN